MVGVLIRMKLAVLRRSMSGQRAASMIAGGAIGMCLAIGTLLLGFSHFASPDAAVALLCIVMLVWTLGWLFGPMLTGGDATLRLEYFTLLPIPARKIAVGMIGAAFIGIAPVVGLVAFAVLIVYGARLGLVPLLISVPAVLLQLLFVVVLSKVGIQALGRLVRSRFGWELSSLVVGFVLGAQNTGWMDIPLLIRVFSGKWAAEAGTVLKALPSGWSVVAVDAAQRKDWALVGESLGGLALLSVLLIAVFGGLLSRHLIRGSGGTAAKTARKDWTASGGPFRGVYGKELRLWARDLRRSRFLSIALWAGLFSGCLPLLDGHVVMLPFAGIITAVFAGALTSNLYGLDAGALWLTLVAQGRERVDVRARQLAWLTITAIPVLALTVGLTFASGVDWAWPWVLAVAPAVLGAGAGLVPLVSLIGVAPFQDRPGGSAMDGFTDESADQVRLKIFGTLGGQLVLAAPAALVVLLGTTRDDDRLAWIGVGIGVVTGLLYAWGFGRLAAWRLRRNGPEILDLMRKGVRAEVQLSKEEAAEEGVEVGPAAGPTGVETALTAVFVLLAILLIIPQGIVSLLLSAFHATLPGWFAVAHVSSGLRIPVAALSIVLGLCSVGGVVLLQLREKRRKQALAKAADEPAVAEPRTPEDDNNNHKEPAPAG